MGIIKPHPNSALGSKRALTGIKLSEDHKRKISLSKVGHLVSQETREKISKTKFGKHREADSPHWKGDKVGYISLHSWVRKNLGKAEKCEDCGSTKKVEWANKSHKYLRKLTDWISLCRKCHCKYDKKHWGLATKKYGLHQHFK